MNTDIPSYRGYRFPREIISYAVWFSFRFRLSFRDVEDLLADLSQESIRQWFNRHPILCDAPGSLDTLDYSFRILAACASSCARADCICATRARSFSTTAAGARATKPVLRSLASLF